MIVYRDQRFRAESRPLLDQLRFSVEQLDFKQSGVHDLAVDAFVSAGMLESAVADALFPQADGVHPLTCALRRLSVRLGHLLWHSWHNAPENGDHWREEVLKAVEDVRQHPLPNTVELTTAEGFAYYGVYPEAYLEAARRLYAATGQFNAVCIGLRSIGAPLSAAVTATLEELGCPVLSFTLRPRGHPYSRHPVLTPELERALVQVPNARFLLVDEGPGITGSSLLGTAGLLGRLGVEDDRIILFPSYETDGAQLQSSEARDRWRRHRRFTVSFEELWIDSGKLGRTLPDWHWQEFSAGSWRKELYPNPSHYPAVQPQHERRKYLLRRDSRRSSESRLLSFWGLGGRSTPRLRRAERLAEAGFTPPPIEIVHGFLCRPFVPGSPLQPGAFDSELLETASSYLAHLGSDHPAEPSVTSASLREMLETNVLEGLGDAWHERLRPRLDALVQSGERYVALDGRMQAHEWIRTGSGYLKTDAFDHHDDHFFPGSQDIAWDIVGATFELQLNFAARRCLVERYRHLSGDRTISTRLPDYALYYLAYRLGYSKLAVSVLGESLDGLRFAKAAERYAELLRQELSHSPNALWDA